MTYTETITLAGGCFWCLEAVFKRVRSVISVSSGYSGGSAADANYEKVCSGKTGHAEAVQITFDSAIVSLEKLLDIFWALHDPTTLNRQGNDSGPQYRSAIFYTEEQKETVIASRDRLAATGTYADPIVTEIVPFTTFYPAEREHADFYDSNRAYCYCRIVIDPKIQKLLKDFKADLA